MARDWYTRFMFDHQRREREEEIQRRMIEALPRAAAADYEEGTERHSEALRRAFVQALVRNKEEAEARAMMAEQNSSFG